MSHAGRLLRQKPKVTRVEVHATICKFCGKKSFSSKEDAVIAALSASKGKGKPFRTYQCLQQREGQRGSTPKPTAPWHMTSQSKERAARYGVV